MSSELIAPGDVIRDTWKVGFVIGQGGMGTAFLATDVRDNTKVAIKALSPQVATPDSLERFEREAAMLAKFQHPNIVKILWVGRHRDLPVIAMTYVEGSSLRAFAESRGGTLALHQVLPLARQMCAALTQIHAHGVVHRDLKPQNILVDNAGRLTLLDFGIARPSDSQLTRTGVVWGTPGYIAPEVIVGEKVITGAADQYAIGAILYELLTGQRPFHELEDEEALLRAHLLNPRPNPCDVLPSLGKQVGIVVQRAMGVRPDERFPSADDLYLSLEMAAMAQPADQPRITKPRPVEDPMTEPSVATVPQPAASAPARKGTGGGRVGTKTTGEQSITDPDPTIERQSVVVDPQATRRRTGENVAAEATRRRTGENLAAQATKRRTGENPVHEDETNPAQPTHQVANPLPRPAAKAEPARPDPFARYRWPVVGGLAGVLLIAVLVALLRPPPEPPPPQPIKKIMPIAPPPTEPELHSSVQMQEREAALEVKEQKADAIAKNPPRARPRVVRQKSITYAGPAGFGELNLTVLVKGNSVPAAVLVDGHPEGQAPMFMPLSPGKHLIVIQRRPFPENVLPIEIKARATTRLEVELQELASGDAL